MNLDDLTDLQRARLLGSTQTTDAARGAFVFAAGDRIDAVFAVLRGRIKIVRATAAGHETIVGIRTPGDLFGEFVVTGAPRKTSAVAIESATVARIAIAEFDAALRADATLADAFARGTARRLATAEIELGELAGKSVPGRLVDTLGRLGADHGVDEPDGSVRIGLPLTHADLADLIGTSRETLTRELRVLADVGLVRVAPRAISLVRPAAFPFVRRGR